MIELQNKIRDIVSQIKLDQEYQNNIQILTEVLHENDNFEFVECTLQVTTKKKGLVVSVYDQSKYKDWLGKIIQLPDSWDLSKLFYKQLLYCRIYLDKYEYDEYTVQKDISNLKKGYVYICLDNAKAKKYPCKCLKECSFRDDSLGIKPYKNIYFYNPFEEKFFLKAPTYHWVTYISYCPNCGVKIN